MDRVPSSTPRNPRPILVPGLALLCCEGCHQGHIAAVVQQHVCKLHQAVSPGLPAFIQVWRLPKLHTEGLQQAGNGEGKVHNIPSLPANPGAQSPGPPGSLNLLTAQRRNKCLHLLSGTDLPEEGTNDDTSVPVVQGKGEVLLCLWDLGGGLLCLKEGVEQAKPRSTTSIDWHG